ncbi:MAG: hypothetical protein QMD43_09880 [Thermodesulfovibrio sp.]|nr:hypothetical protein [Thermodesulfovibrio sp.]
MSEGFLKRAVKKHFQSLGFKVNMGGIKLGNSEIDGEAHGNNQKIAIEIKTFNDDVVRGLGQLCETLAFGYDKAVLVTTIRKAKKIDHTVFKHYGWKLYGVNSKGKVHEIMKTNH